MATKLRSSSRPTCVLGRVDGSAAVAREMEKEKDARWKLAVSSANRGAGRYDGRHRRQGRRGASIPSFVRVCKGSIYWDCAAPLRY